MFQKVRSSFVSESPDLGLQQAYSISEGQQVGKHQCFQAIGAVLRIFATPKHHPEHHHLENNVLLLQDIENKKEKHPCIRKVCLSIILGESVRSRGRVRSSLAEGAASSSCVFAYN